MKNDMQRQVERSACMKKKVVGSAVKMQKSELSVYKLASTLALPIHSETTHVYCDYSRKLHNKKFPTLSIARI